MKTGVGVIFGSRSGEHEISIRSAKTVIEQIDHTMSCRIAITNDGVWLDEGFLDLRNCHMFEDRKQVKH